jgi:hypothetical protein
MTPSEAQPGTAAGRPMLLAAACAALVERRSLSAVAGVAGRSRLRPVRGLSERPAVSAISHGPGRSPRSQPPDLVSLRPQFRGGRLRKGLVGASAQRLPRRRAAAQPAREACHGRRARVQRSQRDQKAAAAVELVVHRGYPPVPARVAGVRRCRGRSGGAADQRHERNGTSRARWYNDRQP